MLIGEAAKAAGLTRKAIEYYIGQGLVKPSARDNGYREFSAEDVERLRRISVWRRLSITADEIGQLLADEAASGELLRQLAARKELAVGRERARQRILQRLSQGGSYQEFQSELEALEEGEVISEKLLTAFPGYYGRFICLHFARFLGAPVKTVRQRAAYERILEFLDNVPMLVYPEELKEYLMEGTKDIGQEQIREVLESVRQSVERPKEFLRENKEVIDRYLAFKASAEYRGSPLAGLLELAREFNSASGYYDVFIPAMKELSPAYAEYHRQVELANERLLAEYPQLADASGQERSLE